MTDQLAGVPKSDKLNQQQTNKSDMINKSTSGVGLKPGSTQLGANSNTETYQSNSELNAFELENVSGLGESHHQLSTAETAATGGAANISSTSQLNLALNTNQNNIRFDDDDENSFLPNDIVEFNSLDELVDYFNSNQDRPSVGGDTNNNNTFSEALKLNSLVQQSSNSTMGGGFNWLISGGAAAATGGGSTHHLHHHHNRLMSDNVNSLASTGVNIMDNSMMSSDDKYMQSLNLVGSEMRASVGQSKSEPDSNKFGYFTSFRRVLATF